MDAPTEKSHSLDKQEENAAQPASFTLCGGEAIEKAAIGAVLQHETPAKSESPSPEKDHKLLKALGVALAVAVPAALIGKQVYSRSVAASQGR